MHYRVRGIDIYSENAAKPIIQGSIPLIRLLDSWPKVEGALDYGCGKLRYTEHLVGKCSFLGIVDSKEQLEKVQKLDGETTTVKDYASHHWPHCQIYDLATFWNGIQKKFDFILCSNVLSAIPCTRTRTLSLRSIHAALSCDGELLVVNQHTNSYFGHAKNKNTSFLYRDGWVTRTRSTGSYYGILTKEKVIALLKRYSFHIKDAWIDGQSNYVVARRK